MTYDEIEKYRQYALASALIGIALIFASLCTTKLGEPTDWLTAWTDWAIKYVALVVSAGSIVGLTNTAAKRLRFGRDTGDNWKKE
jgi:hypothetical protein